MARTPTTRCKPSQTGLPSSADSGWTCPAAQPGPCCTPVPRQAHAQAGGAAQRSVLDGMLRTASRRAPRGAARVRCTATQTLTMQPVCIACQTAFLLPWVDAHPLPGTAPTSAHRFADNR